MIKRIQVGTYNIDLKDDEDGQRAVILGWTEADQDDTTPICVLSIQQLVYIVDRFQKDIARIKFETEYKNWRGWLGSSEA